VFKITKVQKTNAVTYLLEVSCGKPIAGGFYEYKLHRVANPDVYLVEKMLHKRGMKFMLNGWGLTIHTIHGCTKIIYCKIN